MHVFFMFLTPSIGCGSSWAGAFPNLFNEMSNKLRVLVIEKRVVQLTSRFVAFLEMISFTKPSKMTFEMTTLLV